MRTNETLARTRASNAEYLVDNPDRSACDVDVFDFDCDPPLISIVIPTLNDVDTIEDCLSSFKSQKYPCLEIVIIDGESTDGTVSIAEQYADTVVTETGTLGAARAAGLEVANGEIIGMFDADIYLPDEDWLLRAAIRFNYSRSVSTVWPENTSPPDGTALTKLYFDHWHIIMEDRIKNDRSYFGGGNSLFRRDYLEDAGGINRDYHWGEDFEWAKRLKEHGCQTVYHRDPIYHDTMRNFNEFATTQFVGANSFSESGFEATGMGVTMHAYEQFVLGTYGMILGLMRGEHSWALFPIYMMIRATAYSRVLVSPYYGE